MFRFMVKGMKSIVFLLLIAVIFNLFLTPGEPFISVWKLTVTKEGLKLAAMMAVRLVFLIIGLHSFAALSSFHPLTAQRP